MLKDWRHLNVALSRARDFLVIVGSVEFCLNVEHEKSVRANHFLYPGFASLPDQGMVR